MKMKSNEIGRRRPEVLKFPAATMVDGCIVKAIDEKGGLKKLK